MPRPVTRSSLIGNFRFISDNFSPSCSVVIISSLQRCSSTMVGPSVTAAMSNVIITGSADEAWGLVGCVEGSGVERSGSGAVSGAVNGSGMRDLRMHGVRWRGRWR